MVDNSELFGCFSELVRFRQPYNTLYPELEADLVGGNGIQLDQVHPLLTAEILHDTAPEGLDIEQFSQYLRETLESTSREITNRLLEHKALRGATQSLINNMILYNSVGMLSNREIKQGRFVGIAITSITKGNIVNAISRIGIQADSSFEGLPIYLYHSSKTTPIATAQVNSDGGLGYTFTDVKNIVIGYSVNGQLGGNYYLGYFEDDLPSGVQVVNRNFDISQRVCGACNKYNYDSYSAWSKYLAFRYFNVQPSYIAGTEIDFEGITFVNDRNYGLNLAITTECNLSPFFCSNKHMFASAYSKLVGVNLMQKIAYTTRINFVNEQVRNTAISELDPKEGSGSLLDRFNNSLAALDYDFSGFDNNCLPCNKKRIRIGVIG